MKRLVLSAALVVTTLPLMAHAQSVLVANANGNNNASLVSALESSFTTVDQFNIGAGTPTLQELQAYNVVIAYTNSPPSNATASGDVLADYVDQGGCVVMSTYAFSAPWKIAGRIATAGYAPLVDVGTNGNVSGNLNPIVADDPIFNGITLGSLSYFRNSNFSHPDLDAGATLIADDGNGINMIARNGSGNVVGLNLFPGEINGNNGELYTLFSNAAENCAGIVSTTANFQVTKTFSDGETDDVEVTLSCNGGIPLQQSFTISGDGPGVTFVVSNLPDGGADCQVTETAGVDGYTPIYNGGAGCSWTGVTSGLRTCEITNEPSEFDFVVDFEWDETAADASGSVDVNLYCTNVVNPDGSLDTSTRVSPDNPYTATATTDTEFEWLGVGAANDDEDADGDPVNPTTCWAMVPEGGIDDSTVEVSGCEPFVVNVGDDEANCTMTASVFFEGIPTLSQYGLAVMALLMLGVGFVGFRRFV